MNNAKLQNHHIETYFELTQNLNFTDIASMLRERKYSRKDLFATPREINHWAANGLLLDEYDDGKWKKFSLIDVIWISIIAEFRKYDTPLSFIKVLADNLKIDLKKIIVSDFDIIVNFTHELLAPNIREHVQKVELENQFKALLKLDLPRNFFELIVMQTYLLRHQTRFIMNKSGVSTFYSDLFEAEFLESEFYKTNFLVSNLTISMNCIIATIFSDFEVTDLYQKWKLISPKEEFILKELHTDKKLKSIKIKFNEESEMELLETVDEIKVTPYNYVKSLILRGNYMEIKIIAQNGRIATCERTIKKRIK